VPYDEQAKQMMVRLAEKLPPGLGERLADEAARLGPEALRLLLRFPEPLVHAGFRRWVRTVALRMPREQAVGVLIDALAHPDWRIHEIARDGLLEIGPEAREALVKSLAECPSAGGRRQALWCLHRLAETLSPPGEGDASLIQHIERAARADPSEEVRSAAVVALSRCEGPDPAGAILAGLADPSERVRLEAAKAAGRCRLKGAVPRLVEMLAHDDAEVRGDVIYALDRTGDARAAPAVRARLADSDWYVRWAAVKALEGLWEPSNVAALRNALEDPHPLVAAAAAETLAARAAEPVL